MGTIPQAPGSANPPQTIDATIASLIQQLPLLAPLLTALLNLFHSFLAGRAEPAAPIPQPAPPPRPARDLSSSALAPIARRPGRANRKAHHRRATPAIRPATALARRGLLTPPRAEPGVTPGSRQPPTRHKRRRRCEKMATSGAAFAR